MAPHPGDYIAEEVGGAPVVVVRNAAKYTLLERNDLHAVNAAVTTR